MTYWEGDDTGVAAVTPDRWHGLGWALVLGAAVFGLLWLGVA